jgi:hypothetical protein
MTKKRDFIKSEQSRDKHPESGMRGSASDLEARGADSANVDTNPDDRQAPQSGKSANDHNKMGEQTPTQKNEGRRTPESRHDRESHIGGQNQNQARTGGKGGGRSPRGAG